MNTNKILWIIGGLVIVAVLFALLQILPSGKISEQTPPTPQGNITTSTSQAPTGGGKLQTSTAQLPRASKQPQTKPAITILSPAAGNEWVIGKIHQIVWSRGTYLTGGIYLIDAATKQTAGWISPNTAPNQVLYNWDTRDVLLSRSSPQKKDISPGNYIIKIIFDGPEKEAQSAPFSIIYESQVQIPVHTITIQNLAFSPKTTAVSKGDKVVFTNNDFVSHNIRTAGFTIATLAPGESFTLDTAYLSPASYTIYSEAYPTATYTLAVQ